MTENMQADVALSPKAVFVRCCRKSCGAVLAADSVICNDAPDEDAIAQCEALGAALV